MVGSLAWLCSRGAAVTLTSHADLDYCKMALSYLLAGPVSLTTYPAQPAEEEIVLHNGFSHQPSPPVELDL